MLILKPVVSSDEKKLIMTEKIWINFSSSHSVNVDQRLFLNVTTGCELQEISHVMSKMRFYQETFFVSYLGGR
jgi:hypothetical protein